VICGALQHPMGCHRQRLASRVSLLCLPRWQLSRRPPVFISCSCREQLSSLLRLLLLPCCPVLLDPLHFLAQLLQEPHPSSDNS